MTLSSRVDKSVYSHRRILSKTFVGMGGIPSAIIEVGSFTNTDGSLGPSGDSSEGNVGMPLVLRSGSIGSMGIPVVSVGGPGSKISSEPLVIGVTRYRRSDLRYVTVFYTLKHLASHKLYSIDEYTITNCQWLVAKWHGHLWINGSKSAMTTCQWLAVL